MDGNPHGERVYQLSIVASEEKQGDSGRGISVSLWLEI